jgi:LacI family transcriptional regulator
MKTADTITIEDVARAAGVSRAAVSKVMRNAYGVSDHMRTKVESTIEELGYRPRVSARAMRGSTYTIGVSIPSVLNYFFPQIISGANAALGATAYQLIVAPAIPGHEYDEQPMEALLDRQVDGLLAIAPRVHPERLEELAARVPLVMLGRHDASKRYDTIVGDDVVGAELAVRHLADLGHRDIAHLTLSEAEDLGLDGAPHMLRRAAYGTTMTALGLGEHAQVVDVESTELSAHDRALELLQGADRPTAIFAGHDELALGVLSAAAEIGLTPGQLSVIGYDNTDIAAHPLVSMSSIDQSGVHMGEIVIRLLLERINGRHEAVHERITPRLVARASTAPVEPAHPRPSAVRIRTADQLEPAPMAATR